MNHVNDLSPNINYNFIGTWHNILRFLQIQLIEKISAKYNVPIDYLMKYVSVEYGWRKQLPFSIYEDDERCLAMIRNDDFGGRCINQKQNDKYCKKHLTTQHYGDV